ncbi:hypothetical protein HMPREF9373_0859 [Psychrobacter sp. 1501(2011)]|nr:hypothetical protein HMPREF9373_0859 [Psychrobacter sp. 1501(2011)]
MAPVATVYRQQSSSLFSLLLSVLFFSILYFQQSMDWSLRFNVSMTL